MDCQKFDTESGAPLWFMSLPHVKNTSIGVLTNVGSRDEKWPEEAGLAHALEHMFFQGSTVSLKTQKAMSAYTESVGGISNAFTDDEETLYYHKIDTNEIARSVKVFGESIFHPRLKKYYSYANENCFAGNGRPQRFPRCLSRRELDQKKNGRPPSFTNNHRFKRSG